MLLVLVSCSGPKLDVPAPARDLYTSPLFKFSRQYAERVGDEWAIVSALHGLVLPDAMVAPYDCMFKDLDRSSKQSWGWRVHQSLAARYDARQLAQLDVVILAGREYADRLNAVWVELRHQGRAAPRTVAEPLAGMGIGDRLSWLKGFLAAHERGRT